MINIEALKKATALETCPLFAVRTKGEWDKLYNTTQTVDGATIHTDSNGDTYGVITIKGDAEHFYLCGKVLTDTISTIMSTPEIGATIDENNVVIDEWAISIGTLVKSKRNNGQSYLEIKVV